MSRLAWFASLAPVPLLVVIAGCATLPALTFVSDGDDGGAPPTYDATISGGDAGAAPVDDAEAGEDGSLPGDTDDAGSDAASIECGATLVATCAQCPGLPLRCKKGTRDQCIDDCSACVAGSYPCMHCDSPDAGPHGTCVAVGANGQVACTTTGLCECNSPLDCPQVGGAAETCDLVSGHLRCLTCGSPTTADAGCIASDGGAGTCQIADGSAPSCE